LRRLRDHLSEKRTQLALFDNRRFVVELGDLFARMTQRWSQGLPVAHLPAVPA
jgi:predicted O-linked N-acetylglucosamine transferase (SPINDLY family)